MSVSGDLEFLGGAALLLCSVGIVANIEFCVFFVASLVKLRVAYVSVVYLNCLVHLIWF